MQDINQMQDKINSIEKAYRLSTDQILRAGRLPLHSTKNGFWGFSPIPDIYDLFERINLKKSSNFIDLGSGDGRVAAIASLFTESTGIETDPDLCNKAREIIGRLSLQVSILNQDYLEYDLSKYDFLFINPDQPFSNGLEKQLLRQMKGTLIVLEDNFRPLILKIKQTIETPTYKANLYKK
ncbi:hypothetical protein K9M79_00290 [Candidatus Woesearchaeota archaeon]|nr:hypothetical protein [Candidatus Woesearchaeota archaeon]